MQDDRIDFPYFFTRTGELLRKNFLPMKSTIEIASRLVELARQGKFETAQRELYAKDAVSIEPEHSQGFKSVKGLDKIIKKGDEWQKMVEEVHGSSISEPVGAGDQFAVAMSMDVTMKGQGRTTMNEVAVYQVKEGKIVSEQFIY